MWYSWDTLESFAVWHDAVRTALGMPYPGRNAATGRIDESAQWTTTYTDPIVGDDVRAHVDQHVAQMVPDGLGVPCDPPTYTDGTFTPPPAPDEDTDAGDA